MRRPSVSIQQMRVTRFSTAWMLLLALSACGWTSYGGESALPSAVLEPPPQRLIDDYVNSEMETQRIPGLSLAVVREGKIVHTNGYGKASLELDVPATASTLYGLGSICKQFTAAAIMLLVEEGKLPG